MRDLGMGSRSVIVDSPRRSVDIVADLRALVAARTRIGEPNLWGYYPTLSGPVWDARFSLHVVRVLGDKTLPQYLGTAVDAEMVPTEAGTTVALRFSRPGPWRVFILVVGTLLGVSLVAVVALAIIAAQPDTLFAILLGVGGLIGLAVGGSLIRHGKAAEEQEIETAILSVLASGSRSAGDADPPPVRLK
jgi:hypothetical protein